MYSDADVAALYDLLNAWGPSDDFYLDRVMRAASVLDVGCGTGMLLHRARADGHTGRLVGIDPDIPSLDRARRRTDIDWAAGTAASAAWDGEFELAVMGNNAFQCIITDDELRDSLVAIRAALVDGGHFVFETRNPAARAWADWNPSSVMEVEDAAGRRIRVWNEVTAVAGGVVTCSETTADANGLPLRVDWGDLRFVTAEELDGFLDGAGLAVTARYGDFTGGAMTADSKTIVTVAQRI